MLLIVLLDAMATIVGDCDVLAAVLSLQCFRSCVVLR